MSAKLKALAPNKSSNKHDREQAVLFGLVDLYLKSGKPIGSQTLQENGFESLSSATIRNYCALLEEQGFLLQPHTSGGRLPTEKAFRAYADHFYDQGVLEGSQGEILEASLQQQGKDLTSLIHQGIETLSRLSKCSIFISMPRFDQDIVQVVRLLQIDQTRILAAVLTDFGLVRTETLYIDQEIDEEFLQTCERYFLWRLNKGETVSFEKESKLKLAQRLYHEIMVRHLVGYLNFPAEDILRCGMARLLAWPEFNDATAVVNSLALLEDETQMREVLRKCCQKQALSLWIGDELCPHVANNSANAVIAIPYKINQTVAGAVAILGPTRLPYRELFGLIRHFSELLSESLTSAVYKFKISFRQPSFQEGDGKIECDLATEAGRSILLEDKTRTQ